VEARPVLRTSRIRDALIWASPMFREDRPQL
jgi:hypothetical protein